jgi:hypothetical protein
LAPSKRPSAEHQFLRAVLNEVGAVSCPAATGCVAAGGWDGSSSSGGLLHTLLGGSRTLKAAPDPAGAAAPSLFNDGVAGVSCPVAVLGVVAGFHVDTKIFKQGLILTRAG